MREQGALRKGRKGEWEKGRVGGREKGGSSASGFCCWAAFFSFLFAFLLLPSTALAQPVWQLETGFERAVNRYRWVSRAEVEMQAGAWQLAVVNRFLSDAFIQFDDQLNFRDEDQLRWVAGRPLGPTTAFQARGETAWFGQSRVFQQQVLGGVRYTPRPYLWFEPNIGAVVDQRPGVAEAVGTEAPLRMDAGPAYGMRLSYAPPVEGYRIQMQADGIWQSMAPRQGHSLRFGGVMERRFEDTRLISRVRLASARRDAYQSVSFLNRDVTGRQPESVEATTSDTLDASIELDTPFYRGIRFNGRLGLEAGNRFIRTERAPDDVLFFETDFRRRALDAEAALRSERPRLVMRGAVRLGAATERRALANREDLPAAEAAQKSNLLQQADYDEGTFTVLTNVRAMPWQRLVFTFDGSASIIRHDTPEANPDDRDEVFYTGEAGSLLRLSRYLEVDVKVYGSFSHTVYLNAARSAENNKQRSLRLRPTLHWRPSRRTTVRVTPEVRATYTIDDFVLPGRRASDQSAREVRYNADLDQDLGGGLRLLATGTYSDLRLGRLLWDRFAEIPFDTLRTYSAWGRLQAQINPRLFAEVGVRAFIRSDFDRATTVRYPRVDAAGVILRDEQDDVLLTSITRPGRQRIEQLGPTCAITWTMPDGSAIRLDGWFNVQHTRQRLYGGLPEAAAARIEAAARDGTRKIIPNLALTALWRF